MKQYDTKPAGWSITVVLDNGKRENFEICERTKLAALKRFTQMQEFYPSNWARIEPVPLHPLREVD
jgi:hypothetical protein